MQVLVFKTDLGKGSKPEYFMINESINKLVFANFLKLFTRKIPWDS